MEDNLGEAVKADDPDDLVEIDSEGTIHEIPKVEVIAAQNTPPIKMTHASQRDDGTIEVHYRMAERGGIFVKKWKYAAAIVLSTAIGTVAGLYTAHKVQTDRTAIGSQPKAADPRVYVDLCKFILEK